MNNDIVQQGSFTSTGVNYTIKLTSPINWLRVINLTETAANNAGRGVEYYWQQGMGTSGVIYTRSAAAAQALGSNVGTAIFTSIDSSLQTLGAAIATTAGTDAFQPVYSTGTTTGLAAGAVVRIFGTDHTDINGLDFTIGAVSASTSFTLGNTLATQPGAVANTGTWTLVAHNLDEYKLIKPSYRLISKITKGTTTVVSTLVDHGYSVGQRIKFSVPNSIYGMVELDGLYGTITAVSAAGAWPQTFTVDIDSSGFTTFTYPTIAQVTATGAFTPAQCFPMGQGTTGTYNYTFEDAFTNQAFKGMILTSGTTGPAGSLGDSIVWQAGKSFNQ